MAIEDPWAAPGPGVFAGLLAGLTRRFLIELFICAFDAEMVAPPLPSLCAL